MTDEPQDVMCDNCGDEGCASCLPCDDPAMDTEVPWGSPR